MNELGKTLVVFGLVIVAIGALVWAGYGKWFGKLPGDVHYSRGDFSFHFPIVTCLLISIVLTILISIYRR